MQLMYQNDHYKIVGNPEVQAYQVINLQTEIVEFQDRAYPKCQLVANEYSKGITKFEETMKNAEVQDATNIVPIR